MTRFHSVPRSRTLSISSVIGIATLPSTPSNPCRENLNPLRPGSRARSRRRLVTRRKTSIAYASPADHQAAWVPCTPRQDKDAARSSRAQSAASGHGWTPKSAAAARSSSRRTRGGRRRGLLSKPVHGAAQRVTDHPDYCPAWSPDGSRLVIAAAGSQRDSHLDVTDLWGDELPHARPRLPRVDQPSSSPTAGACVVAARTSDRKLRLYRFRRRGPTDLPSTRASGRTSVSSGPVSATVAGAVRHLGRRPARFLPRHRRPRPGRTRTPATKQVSTRPSATIGDAPVACTEVTQQGQGTSELEALQQHRRLPSVRDPEGRCYAGRIGARRRSSITASRGWRQPTLR